MRTKHLNLSLSQLGEVAFLFSITIFAFLPRLAFCQTEPAQIQQATNRQSLTTQLQGLRRQIDEEGGKLKAVREKSQQLQISFDVLEKEISMKLQEEADLKDILRKLSDRSQELQDSVRVAEEKVKTETELFRKRIVAVYKMNRRLIPAHYLMHAQSATDLLRRIRLLMEVTKHDQKKLSRFTGALVDLQAKEEKLRRTKEEGEKELAQRRILSEQLEQKRFSQGLLFHEVKEQVKLKETVLEKLNNSLKKFERLMSSIMGSTEVDEARPGESLGATSQESVSQTSLMPLPFKGSGLSTLKGKLASPVQGQLIQRFGKQHHEEFTDILFVKGLEFSASVGSKVRCVADGMIVLNQVLPGYGNVVIVDHGARYYTLYGRLASSLSQVNNRIRAGDVIAVLGEPDHRGRNFYFELRIEGKAVDPLEFFREKLEVVKG